MRNKLDKVGNLVAQIPSGSRLMVGGFGSPGTPFTFIDELVNQGQTNLTIIKNDANEPNIGISKLIQANQVDHIIATHIGLNPLVMEKEEAGELTVELIPQGILAERIRCKGVGVAGFVSKIGLGTDYEKGKIKVVIDDATLLFEPAIGADFALIHAQTADYFGNMLFNSTGINFSPMMALAADKTFLETKNLLPVGDIEPSQVNLSGVVVDSLIHVTEPSHEYEPIRR